MKYAALIFAILAVVFGTLYFMKTKEMNETVASLTNKANQLETSVSEKDSQIETLNGQISTLTDEVTNQNTTIDSLNGTIADRNAEISTLNMNSNLRKWQIDQLTSNLSDKNATIKTLNETVANYETTLGTMGEYNREIEGLLVQASDLLVKIGELNSTIESGKETPSAESDAAVSGEAIENAVPAGEEIPAADDTDAAQNPDETNVAEEAVTVIDLSTDSAAAETGTEIPEEALTRSPLSQRLLDMLEQNPGLEEQLKASIARAAEINPDPETNPVQSIEALLDYMDASVTRIPEVEGENFAGKQERHYLAWLLDQPLEELAESGMARPTVRYLEPVSLWLDEVSNTFNEYLISEASWSPAIYEALLQLPEWNLNKDWYEAAENWKSLRDFYTRRLAGPMARPVAVPEDNTVIVAPADSASREVLAIREDGGIVSPAADLAASEVTVAQILGTEGADVAPLFNGGTLTYMTLNDNDYHHFHSPVSGTVTAVYQIPAAGGAGTVITWDPEKKQYVRDACSLSWLTSEGRGVVVIESDAGTMALIPVDNGMISGLEFGEEIKPGKELSKGDEIGCFLFGGSDIVMLFEGKAGFTLTEKPADEADAETGHLLCGEEYGRITAETPAATPAESTTDESSTEAPAAAAEEADSTEAPAAAAEEADSTEAPAAAAEEADSTEAPATAAEEADSTEAPAAAAEEANSTEAPDAAAEPAPAKNEAEATVSAE